jgi:hypothetical protein
MHDCECNGGLSNATRPKDSKAGTLLLQKHGYSPFNVLILSMENFRTRVEKWQIFSVLTSERLGV